jgi:hypothetical protein
MMASAALTHRVDNKITRGFNRVDVRATNVANRAHRRQAKTLNLAHRVTARDVWMATGWLGAQMPGLRAVPGLRAPSGFQKFVGFTVRTSVAHGLQHPIIMDATIAQGDGYHGVRVGVCRAPGAVGILLGSVFEFARNHRRVCSVGDLSLHFWFHQHIVQVLILIF